MSEMDDELKRMLETPEDRIRREAAEERRELINQTHSEALAEYRQREQKQSQERRRATIHKYRWPIRIGGAVLVGLMSVGGVFGVEAINKSDNELTIQHGEEPQLTNVEDLRADGTCAADLQAESEYYEGQVRYASSSYYGTQLQATSMRFKNAAKLASENSINCTPESHDPQNLTPDFNVNTLKDKRECADELLAQRVDPNTAQNGYYYGVLRIENLKDTLAAQLASEYHIPC